MTLELLWTRWRQLRRQLRMFWKLPDSWQLFTPGFACVCVVTAICAGLTYTSWALTRLLQSQAAVEAVAERLPSRLLELPALLPALLADTSSTTAVVAGALVDPQLYIYTYAFGFATAFCLLLLLIVFVRRW